MNTNRYRSVIVLASVLLAGCSWAGDTTAQPAPDVYSISPDFSHGQEQIIQDAFQSWCGAVGYCPARVDWTGPDAVGAVRVAELYDRTLPDGETVLGRNHGDSITIDLRWPSLDDPELFWKLAAHEVGHYGIPDHLDSGLMQPRPGRHDRIAIDDAALAAWGEP